MSTDTPSSASSAASPHYRDIPGKRFGYIEASSPHYAKPLLIEQMYIEDDQPLCPLPRLTHHLISILLKGDAESYRRPHTSTRTQTISLTQGDAFVLNVSSRGKWGWRTTGLNVLFVHLPPTMVHRVAASHRLDDAHAQLHSAVLHGDRVLHLLGRSLARVVEEKAPVAGQHSIAQSIAQALTLRGLLKSSRARDAPSLLEKTQGPLSAPGREWSLGLFK